MIFSRLTNALSMSLVLSRSIGGNQGTNSLKGEVVYLGCPEQQPQQHNYTHTAVDT